MTFLATGDQASPDIYVETLAPGDGPPLHRHPWMTWEVVVAGRIRALVGDETFELGPGNPTWCSSAAATTTLAHQPGWSEKLKPDGTYELTAPDGRHWTTVPPGL